MKYFSLFTGIGGIDIAAEWAGFQIMGMCEIDDFCLKILNKHWPDIPKWRDIYELSGKDIEEKCGKIDLLSGGFPCQPFSITGKRKGFVDDRYLWPEMLRIIREIRPKWVLGENVPGIFSIRYDGQYLYGEILKDLAQIGYNVGWLCYGASDIGAPHRRERVFIVAHSSGGDGEASFLLEQGGIRGSQGQFRRFRGDKRRNYAREWSMEIKPRVVRVANGIPFELDERLKALGNAVVPQQVFPILKAIKDIESQRLGKMINRESKPGKDILK